MLDVLDLSRLNNWHPPMSLPEEQPAPIENANIIILKEEPPIQEEAVIFAEFQQLFNYIHQMARFPQSADPEKIAELASLISEALQKDPCFTLEQDQKRVLQLRQMLREAEQLPGSERLCTVLHQHLLHTEQAARMRYCDSATPVQDSLWTLHERILRLPTLEPDLFGAAVAMLKESLPRLVLSHPLAKDLQDLIPRLRPPSHYFWRKSEPFIDALNQIIIIKNACLKLLIRIKNAPDSYIKIFHIPMESVYENYRCFIEAFQKGSAETRAKLCIPKAQLSGPGLGFFSLSQEQARDILCRDLQGTIVKKNPLGTHPVYAEAGVFYKPNSEGGFYIGPEMEFAIYAFYQLLGEAGVVPTSLLKVRHVFFEGQDGPFGRVLQAGFGIDGLSLQDLFGMVHHVLPSLNRLGPKQTQMLLEGQWEQDFINQHLGLSADGLSNLSLEQSIELLISKFETLSPDLRCLEFVEMPIPNGTRDVFRSQFIRYSSGILVSVLALLQAYPTLAKCGPRQTSLTELTSFCYLLKKIRRIFPSLSAEQLLEEMPHWLARFTSTNFSAHFLVSVLTNPQDHHSDNLMVTLEKNAQGGVSSFSLVGIDNDRAFAPSDVGVKTIVYLLESMKMGFDEQLTNRILTATAEGLIFDWLVALEEQNQRYQNLQTKGVLTHQDLFEGGNPSLNVPLLIDAQLIPSIYEKARKLVAQLAAHPSSTHWDLLAVVQPKVAHAYREALKLYSTPTEAYDRVSTCFNHDPSLPVPVVMQTPAEAAVAFIEGIDLETLPLMVRVSLMGKAQRTFPAAARHLTLPGDPKQPLSRREFFHMAVSQGYHALVGRLLEDERKARLESDVELSLSLLEVKNANEQTALLLACYRLDLDMIRLLIDYGADSQVRDSAGRSPLMTCLIRFTNAPGQTAAVVRFLGDHAPLFFNARCNLGWTALHYLVDIIYNTDLEEAEPLIAFLINKGASPDIVDHNGNTVLDYAIERGQERVVEQLIRLGAGRTLRVPAARAFFDARPHLIASFVLLQKQSLLLRWYLALGALRELQFDGAAVSLHGVQLGKIKLDPAVLKTLLHSNGDIIKQTEYGTRNVCSLRLPDGQLLFLKQNPEDPGTEYAIGKLFELLIGHGSSFTDLAKMTLPNGKSYPVLISQGIQGKNLRDVLSDTSTIKHLEKLDHLAFSELFLASLLVNFGDANPGNFILEPQPGGIYRLVGVDNDRAFVPALREGSRIQIKCILYCLNIMRDKPIHPVARERFLTFEPENLLRIWLRQLETQSQCYTALYATNSISFSQGVMADLYQQFLRMRIALKESSNSSHLEFLRLVIPSAGVYYQEAFRHYDHPLDRYTFIGNPESKAMASRLGTLLGSQKAFKWISTLKKTEKGPKISPTWALQELNRLRTEMQIPAQHLKRIRDGLQEGNVGLLTNIKPDQMQEDEVIFFNQLTLDMIKEKVINGVPGEFGGIDFSAMKMGRQPDLERQTTVLNVLVTGNYRSLRINGCAVLDKKALNQILRNSPQLLSLELCNCPSVTEELLSSLSQASYLAHLRLTDLAQLKQIVLPHPNLHRLDILRCRVLKRLTVSHTLKSLSVEACWNLLTIEAKFFETTFFLSKPQLKKNLRADFVLQKLRLKACPQLRPWWTIFERWLKTSTENEIQLQNVPPGPDERQLGLVVKSVLVHPQRKEMMESLETFYKGSEIEPLFSLLKEYQTNFLNRKHKNNSLVEPGQYTSVYTNGYIDSWWQLLARYCPNLTTLDLSKCYITDIGLRGLANYSSKVTRVNLAGRYSSGITDVGLRALVNGCPNLDSLDLSYCNEITDFGLKVLASCRPNLRFIKLSGCDGTTELGLQALQRGCPNLKMDLTSWVTSEQKKERKSRNAPLVDWYGSPG